MPDLIAGEVLLASLEDRTVTGLLMPWDEESRIASTGNKPIAFPRGTLAVPADVSVVGANLAHDRYQPIGRAVSIEDKDRGLVATFSIARTPEGDSLLADLKDRATAKYSRLSAEVRDIVRVGARAVSAVLTGAAFVTEGAFESAALFAIGDITDQPADDTSIADPLEPVDGDIAIDATELPATVTVTVGEESTTYNPQEATVPAATIPETLNASTNTDPTPTRLHDVAEALALFASRGDRTLIDAISDKPHGETGMFALNDIKTTTTGGVGVAMIQPQWIGELWKGRSYERRVIPLLNSGNLTSFKVSGFRWTTKPAMNTWAGDKALVPTNTPATTAYSVDAKRWAGGHDIAREFRDFDVPGFWESYFAAMTDSYAKLTDDQALADLVAGATAVTAGAVPTGVNSGLVSIVDGALAVLPVGVPTFALVASDVYRSLALVKDIDRLAFLNASLGLEEGSVSEFKVVPHPGLAAGKALVGVKNAATSYELPGSPIRTEALDQIKGGLDEALFGYSAVTIDNAAGLALVTPA